MAKIKKSTPIKGFKMFDSDWQCRGFQYEVGKSYNFEGEIELCSSGFHFCKKLEDCFKNYDCVTWNRIAEIEAWGNIKECDDKCVCDNIKIVKEIKFNEISDFIKNNYSNGVNESNGVNWSFGILNSFGVDNALFLANKKRTYSIFGKKINKEKFKTICNEFFKKLNGWTPTFNNLKSLYLKYGSEWKLTPIHRAQEISKEEAWRDMPIEAIEYLKSLDEFDPDMFFEITGIKV